MKSQFAFVGFLALWLCLSAHGKPVLEKDFFWYETDDGRFVPAFLKETAPISTTGVEDDVIFWHYLPGQQEGRQVLPQCTDNCLSGFIRNAPLVVAAHGFSSSHTGGFGTKIRGGFGNRSEDVNLVFINWARLSSLPDYAGAANNVRPVGVYAASLINFLVEQGVATLDKTFFIGHSLGAHIANHVAASLNGGKMKTIFALDPAWPLFDRKGDEDRIDPSDAEFVNVIHTSMDYLGFEEPRGHVDFYPNEGEDQPGCGIDLVDKCSHSRAYHFLGESIGWPRAFEACKCNNWDDFEDGRCSCDDRVHMGWETPSTARGSYYLRTNAQSPYGQH